MPNPWFRMYSEFRSDPKVRSMSEPFQLRLLWLLTLRCEGPTEKLSRDELCFGLACDETTLETLHETFFKKGFIEKDWSIANWCKRQYISDTSTERVRKFRDSRKNSVEKQDETFPETHETRNETDQNRTEQIQNRSKQRNTLARSVPPEELAGTLPLVDGTEFSISKSQVAEWSDAFPSVDVKSELRRFKVWLDANPTRRKTRKGILRAAVSWLSRAQDSGRGNGKPVRDIPRDPTGGRTQKLREQVSDAYFSQVKSTFEMGGNVSEYDLAMLKEEGVTA